MSSLSALVPAGNLPKWLLLVSALAVFNTIQNLVTLSLTKQVYSAKPDEVTELSSRTFAVWSFTSAVVRFYCAYNISNKAMYEITLWTYVIALTHFTSELLIFRSADIGPGWLSPFIVATVSLIWMTTQYNHYVNREKKDK